MSGRSFHSVFMVASCAAAALGCYLVSLRVASERAALEGIETEIVLAQRDIRLLQTEIGTRGRLAQLERWNVKVLALSAPSADQFVNGGFELAKMVAPERKVDLEAPVVLAAAPADAPKPQVEGLERRAQDAEEGLSGKQLLHSASLKRPAPASATPVLPDDQPQAAPKPATPGAKPAKSDADKPAPLEAKAPAKKSVDRPTAAKPATKSARLAKADPLAPLPGSKSAKTAKDSGPAR